MSNYPWLIWLQTNSGQVEWTGNLPSEFVRSCFLHTNYGSIGDTTPPACAATMCAALEESGYTSPHSAAARSFLHYGIQLDELKEGAICVFSFVQGHHHVTCCSNVIDDERAEFIGGNQKSKLQTCVYDRRYIVAMRWPLK